MRNRNKLLITGTPSLAFFLFPEKAVITVLRKYDENDFLARLFLLCNALFHGITGLYLVLSADVEYQSETYRAMSSLLSLDAWGCVFIAVAVLFIFATFEEGRHKRYFMLVSGVLGGIMLGLYAMASAEMGVNIMIPIRYAVIASFNILIAGVGGLSLWRRKV